MYVLKLEGMTCGGCARRIENAVKKIDQESRFQFDLEQKKVNLETNLNPDALREIVTQLGYAVLELKKE